MMVVGMDNCPAVDDHLVVDIDNSVPDNKQLLIKKSKKRELDKNKKSK